MPENNSSNVSEESEGKLFQKKVEKLTYEEITKITGLGVGNEA